MHRYVGLGVAGFLVVAGLTGSLLAWNDELEAALSPQLFRATPPAPDAQALDPLVLRAHVAGHYPKVWVLYAPLKVEAGRSVLFAIEGAPNPRTGDPAELPNDQVFVNPYTGEVLGERKWGDISQGIKNLMPFLYRLHYSLALGTVGGYLMGIVALLWTIDCFVGAYLTFPARRCKRESGPHPRPLSPEDRSWPSRWWPSWKVRVRSGAYKLNFDLHRAGGLWPWSMLLVLAWSSVAFNLSEVYSPVMRAVFAHQPDEALPRLATLQPEPGIGWIDAREIGRHLMQAEAGARDFEVLEEQALRYDPHTGVYRYSVRSSRDIRDHGGSTSVVFDASTGVRRGLWLPTGAASGDTIRTWITSLHMATLWGIPFKVLICVLGLAVAMLSVTGIVIWWRKHRARRSRYIGARPWVIPSHPGSEPQRPAGEATAYKRRATGLIT
ncbi:MAG: PepSY-associated TM helix domain-containing protein [Gammaproteobacteria bacterium]